MPNLKIPHPLRPYTAQEKSLWLPGETVGDLLLAASSQHPDLEKFLFEEAGQLRTFMNVFLNEENVDQLQGLDTPLSAEDTVLIIPAIAGG